LRSGDALASCATNINTPPTASIESESQSRRIYLSASEGMLQSWYTLWNERLRGSTRFEKK
jgi:hypothetical protein